MSAVRDDALSPALLAYFTQLRTRPATHHTPGISVRCDAVKGRYLESPSQPIAASSQVFLESAALSVSDDVSVCLACHDRHTLVDCVRRSKTTRRLRAARKVDICAAYRTMIEPLTPLLYAAEDIAQAYQYPTARLMALVKYIALTCNNGTTSSRSRSSLFARSNDAPSFSLIQDATETDSAPQVHNNLTPAVTPLQPLSTSLSSLALSTVRELDAGKMPPDNPLHARVADELWRQLPVSYRRQIKPALMTKFLLICQFNSHELIDDRQESGEAVFPFFAMIEHSCNENCAFTIADKSIMIQSAENIHNPIVIVNALRDIPPHTPLSINYANPYEPTSRRRQYLLDAYHFTCHCDICDGRIADRTRAFKCPSCHACVYPYGITSDVDINVRSWRCANSQCKALVKEHDVLSWYRAERWLEKLCLHVDEMISGDDDSQQTKYDSLIDVVHAVCAYVTQRSDTPNNPIRNGKPRTARLDDDVSEIVWDVTRIPFDDLQAIAPSHHCYHHLLDIIIITLTSSCRSIIPSTIAEQVIIYAQQRINNLIVFYDNRAHWLLASEYDRFAQLCVRCDDLAQSRLYYERCYRMNVQCFGDKSTVTVTAKKRMSSPPQSIDELKLEYA